MNRSLCTAFLLPLVVAWGCGTVEAPADAGQPAGSFDHSHTRWSQILATHARDGGFAYRAALPEVAALDAYLAELAAVTRAGYGTWSEAQQVAFWINVYNAYMVKAVLDHYPLESVRTIGLIPMSIFRRDFLPFPHLLGGSVSLNHVEHEILRREFVEPRIHFALVCASKGCPPLRGEAYRGPDLDAQLADQGATYLGDPRHARYDPAANTVYLPEVFDWFEEDFLKVAGSVAEYARPYLGNPLDAKVRFIDWDWSLNEVAAGGS